LKPHFAGGLMPQLRNLLLHFLLSPDLFGVSNEIHKTTSYITTGGTKSWL